MKEVDKAYIAGFLDGDGSIMASIEPHREMRFGYRIRIVVKFAQCIEGKPLLDELHTLCGIGYVACSGRSAEYVIKGKNEVVQLLKTIQPYVRSKQRQLVMALSVLANAVPRTTEELEKLAAMADAIAEENIKSRSRRKHTLSSITPVTTQEHFLDGSSLIER